MSENSTRRRAELAVINAACKHRDAHSYKAATEAVSPEERVRLGVQTTRELWAAIEEYEALALATPSQPAQSNNSTDTSREAGASLGNIVGDARMVYDEILLAGGLTVDQIEQLLNRSHQSMSARVNDLMNKGWVVDSGIRRRTRSNRKAIVWKPSATALKQGWVP